MQDIILATINARYIHASLGLRYLYANMDELQPRTRMQEFTLEQRAEDMAELLLEDDVRIIGFGVYIWNVVQTLELMQLIRVIRPDIKLIVGGPEVSHELDDQEITQLADFVVLGAADMAFADLCRDIIAGTPPPAIVSSLPLDLDALQSPYRFYSDEDVAQRVLYVEASRGCPFKCEFCLSSLDKSATSFDLDEFLQQMGYLIERGARQFKFVDRTFNLKAETSRRILEFFLAHMDRNLFLHFELIPDRLPEVLLSLLPRFPENSLQFEIGIQSFNPDVQKRISRKQQHERTCHNLRWLRDNTTAHIHADLIFGLPGETLESFGEGFDLLYSLRPQEIQVGLLKRLRGTPIERHREAFDMRYMSRPPYRILSHSHADFTTVQRMVRFARYWDLIGNSGRFPATLIMVLADKPFEHFMQLSDWIFQSTTQTHRIALPRLFELLCEHLITVRLLDTEHVHETLHADFKHNRLKGLPQFLHSEKHSGSKKTRNSAERQSRHGAAMT